MAFCAETGYLFPQAAKKAPKDPELLKARQEILQLCQQHIEELENLEKRKFNEAYMADRADLMSGGSRQTYYAGGRAMSQFFVDDEFYKFAYCRY